LPGLIRTVTVTSAAFRPPSRIATGLVWDMNSTLPPSWESVMLTFTVIAGVFAMGRAWQIWRNFPELH
jgi:hypothetical protein